MPGRRSDHDVRVRILGAFNIVTEETIQCSGFIGDGVIASIMEQTASRDSFHLAIRPLSLLLALVVLGESTDP